MNTTSIVLAAGPGTRLGAGVPKGFVLLRGVPLVVRAIGALLAAPAIRSVVVVVPVGERPSAMQLVGRHGPWRCPVAVIEGGQARQDSVRAGLGELQGAELVAIHDAARPFITADVVQRVVAEAARHGAAIVAVPAADTVKQVNPEGWIESTPARETLWLAQTPQVFRTDVIRAAHARALADRVTATDDAALVERMGVPVRVVRGRPENRKITTPDDLRWAESFLSTAALR